MDQIIQVNEQADYRIMEYRHNGDIHRLLREIREIASDLLTLAAAVAGNLDRAAVKSVTDSVEAKLMATDFAPFWKRLRFELSRLFRERADWKSVKIYKNLSQIVMSTFNYLGIYPDLDHDSFADGVFIDVPFERRGSPRS